MEPEDTIDYNLRKTWYSIAKYYNRTANEYMGSMALGMILLNIDMYEGTPSTQLGPNMGMEATSLTRSLNSLEKLGVIERIKDPNDKRKTIIYLTKFGKKRREIAKKTVIDLNNAIFDKLDSHEINTFFNVMSKINKIMSKY